MGIYFQLIVRYLRLDPQMLINSLRDAKLEAIRDARPMLSIPEPQRGMAIQSPDQRRPCSCASLLSHADQDHRRSRPMEVSND
jgi:hypothetical protein